MYNLGILNLLSSAIFGHTHLVKNWAMSNKDLFLASYFQIPWKSSKWTFFLLSQFKSQPFP